MLLPKVHFSIVKKEKLWLTISAAIIALGCFFILTQGFNMGIDFTGGTSQMIRFDKTPKLQKIREVLKAADIEGVDLDKVQLQMIENKDVVIKSPQLNEEQRKDVIDVLETNLGELNVLEVDTVGPAIGEELQRSSIWILIWALGLLLVYITFRFEVWYALAAIIALIHDALITLGITAMLHLEINVQFIAALLTILGYSINDTIVIFDRMRENIKQYRHNKTIAEIADISLWQTMSRSINTVLTVLIPLTAIFLFGGITIHEFALVMLIGITSGAYSSIFIAAPFYVILKRFEA